MSRRRERAKGAAVWGAAALIALLALAGGSALAKQEFVVGLASWSDEAVDFYQNVVAKQFEALYPDLEVSIQRIGWSADQIAVRYASGVAPDVIQFGSDKFGSYAAMLEPLDRFMASRPIEAFEDIPEPALASSRKDGRLYAVPWHIEVRTLVYNKELFRQAGIDASQGPSTWDEVREYARKTTSRTADGTWRVEGVKIEPHWYVFAPWVFQAGGRYVEDDGVTSGLRGEGVRRAIEFAYDLVHEAGVTADPGLKLTFAAGQSAMAIENVEAVFGGSGVQASDVGVSAPPADVRSTTLVAPSVWAVNNRSAHKDAAWDWIRLSTSVESFAEMGRRLLALPPRLSLVDEPPMSLDPRIRLFLELSGIATSFNGSNPAFEEVMHEVVSPTLSAIIFDGEPVTLLEQAAERADQMLREALQHAE